MAAAPIRIGRVRLAVRDLAGTARFYETAVGLIRHDSADGRVLLGAPEAPLLELEARPEARPRARGTAGLFHTAFLLPGRADLGRWLEHAGAEGLHLEGAADHLVSEAVYLSDPEGNGIEIYADRPPADWPRPARGEAGTVRMANAPLDAQGLGRAASGTRWSGFPEGGIIGHVHLQVGDTAEADAFYAGILGFDIATRLPGASFYGSGGYHHQLAGNNWSSRDAGKRADAEAGLAALELVYADTAMRDAACEAARAAGTLAGQGTGPDALRDPWGTRIELRR